MKKVIKGTFIAIVLMIILLVIGVIISESFRNNIMSTTTDKDERIVRYADVSEVENPRIFCGYTNVYSETGAVLEEYFEDSIYFDFSDNYDHTMGVVVDKGILYLIDGRLEPKVICDDTGRYAQMCKDGGYVLYENQGNGSGLYVYDIENDDSILITAGNVSEYVISSNGKYVIYNGYNTDGAYIACTDGESEPVKISNHSLTPRYISRDGQRAFFSEFDDGVTIVFYYNEGELEAIGNCSNYPDYVVNDDCTEIFFGGYSNLYYFCSGMESAKEILNERVSYFYTGSQVVGIKGRYSDVEVSDVPTFRGCIFTGNDSFYFKDENTILLKLDEFVYKDPYTVSEEGTFLYDELGGKGIMVAITDDGEVSSDISGVDFNVSSIEGSDNCETIWLVSYEDELYEYKDGKATFICKAERGIDSLHYDKYERKVFFFEDECLCSVKEGEKEVVREYDGCRSSGYSSYLYGDFVFIKDEKNRRLVRIFGNYVEVKR